ncbi:B-cell differentiation antigen CD72-like [Microcaecilia unicolor]|uniref:B-cell differentiation antigen CD72-like n=1 Tax=Microcaecilia unicolor TaxID=1415580 RepID=A0A6P7X5B5_9AMPH|nr:B-cell differentiation antigen CD72-like [Microcaecilia unicolor]
MADVTYADLKFVPNAKKSKCPEPQQTGSKQEDEDGEITYENIQGPRIKESKATPEAARTGKEGFSFLGSWTPHIALVLLVACVCLLTISIALGVRFMQVSQQMSEDYEILNSNFSQSMRLTGRDLKDTEEELHHSELKLKETRDSLEQVLQKLNDTERELDNMSWNLNETEKRLNNNIETMEALKKERDTLSSTLERTKQELAATPERWLVAGCRSLARCHSLGASLGHIIGSPL